MAQNAQDHLVPAFKLERFFAKYEFSSRFLLSSSECEPLSLAETLQLADDDCRRMWDNLSLSYTESQGLPALRQEICRQYTKVRPEQVLVAAPQELINMAMQAMLRPGDHVVCIYPGYQSLYELARHSGCKVSLWEPDLQPDGSYAFNVDKLAKLVTPQTRAVVTNAPHNPTGALPSHKEWARIVELCRGCGAYLFSDEMYWGLERDPSDRLPAAADAYERGISLSGMSKAYGMPGIRIGWLAVRDEGLMQGLQRLHDYSTICSSAPSEVLALIGLRAAEKLKARNLAIIEANIAHFAAFCKRHGGVFAFAAPRAGSIAFARLLTGEPIDAFCDRLVAQSGVLLLPATVYDHAASVKSGCLRVGLGKKNLPECLQALEAFMEQEPQRKES